MSETKTYPTPWSLSMEGGDSYIRDSSGNALACDMQYYPWIEPDAMPIIVRAVNNHDSLLAACKKVSAAFSKSKLPAAFQYLEDLKDMSAAVLEVHKAIKQAEEAQIKGAR